MIFKDFFKSGSISSILLIVCVIISLTIANSQWSESFVQLLATEIGFNTAQIELRYPLLIWINDGLMAIFFLLIGLEIKREMAEGALSTFKKASLPVFAAFGGAVVPALIFYAINYGTEIERGWGIPMATDIAFALSILAILGRRVPASLKIFLAALAIVDDLIAILVIALFYSDDLRSDSLLYAAAIFILMMVFNRLKLKNLWFYILPAIFLWYFIHHSGVHATIAGVVAAFTLPTKHGSEDSPLEKLEHILNRPVNFIIMPVFALANTNVSIRNVSVDMITGGLGTGIMIGLILGKPVGITLLSWITVKLKFSALPTGSQWKHILGLGMIGGIGFTMSIFIVILSFSDPALQNASKVSVLIASAVSGLIGFFFLLSTGRKRSTSSSQEPG